MPAEASFPAGMLYGFLLVLARVSGAISLVPLPGVKGAPGPARVVFSVALTLALYARWPAIDAAGITPPVLAAGALAEAVVGLAIGVSVSIVLEAFALAAQVAGLQAGYSYASTVDPSSEANSTVLVVFAQLVAGMLFFTIGLDREILRLFAASLDAIPPGSYPRALSAAPLISLGAGLFSVGARLALPVVAVLLILELALALLGRLNQQLQLVTLAFPAKMLVGVLILSWILPLAPRILAGFGAQALGAARRALGM